MDEDFPEFVEEDDEDEAAVRSDDGDADDEDEYVHGAGGAEAEDADLAERFGAMPSPSKVFAIVLTCNHFLVSMMPS